MEPHPEIWHKEIQRLKRRIHSLEDQNNLHVFYGSSSVRLWVNMSRDLAPLNVLNLGFGGSSFEWCNHYFEELFVDVMPSKLIFYAGENDLSNGTFPDRVMYNFEKLFAKARRHYPGKPITIISLKPSLKRSDLIPKIEEVNWLLQRFVKNTPNTTYIDTYLKMLTNNGDVRPDLFLSDGLHMNREGYKIWTQVVRTHFQLDG